MLIYNPEGSVARFYSTDCLIHYLVHGLPCGPKAAVQADLYSDG